MNNQNTSQNIYGHITIVSIIIIITMSARVTCVVAGRSNPVALTLTAIQHLATGTVTTDERVPDITVTIK